jgi:hypothetical protein
MTIPVNRLFIIISVFKRSSQPFVSFLLPGIIRESLLSIEGGEAEYRLMTDVRIFVL